MADGLTHTKIKLNGGRIETRVLDGVGLGCTRAGYEGAGFGRG